jgi:hypothetical protein
VIATLTPTTFHPSSSHARRGAPLVPLGPAQSWRVKEGGGSADGAAALVGDDHVRAVLAEVAECERDAGGDGSFRDRERLGGLRRPRQRDQGDVASHPAASVAFAEGHALRGHVVAPLAAVVAEDQVDRGRRGGSARPVEAVRRGDREAGADQPAGA